MTIVTAYANLGTEGLKNSLAETGAKAIFCSGKLLAPVIESLRHPNSIRDIIYDDDASIKDLLALKTEYAHLTVIPYNDLVVLGTESNVLPVPPRPEDLACIMYTSGSSGKSKGVLLTHRNVIAAGNYPALFNFKYSLGSGESLPLSGGETETAVGLSTACSHL